MFTVYVLKSLIAEKSYVGFTNNIKERLRQHNSGQNYFTKRYMPWRLIYKEEFEKREEAIKREKYLKSASGRRIVLKKLFN